MNNNDGTLTKHLFEKYGGLEDRSRAPVNGLACSEATSGTRQSLPGPLPPVCIQKHFPSLNTVPASALNKTLKQQSEILTYLLNKKKSVIYVDLVGFQCCPAVTAEPVT